LDDFHPEEKIAHNRKQHKIKMDALQMSLEAANTELLLVEKDRRDGMARVEECEAEVRSLEAAIADETKNTDDEIKEIIHTFKAMENTILEKNRQLILAVSEA